MLPRVRAKLAAEPVEDLRVDAEDGYRRAAGRRGRRRAARRPRRRRAPTSRPGWRRRRRDPRQVASRRPPGTAASAPWTSSSAPPAAGPLPRLVVTLPKVTDVEQVRGVPAGPRRAGGTRTGCTRCDLELQIETPQAVLGPDGTATVARMVHAAGPRLIGLHYGTYDYSAALGIAAAHQASDHPAADFAKQLMQVAVAGTGAQRRRRLDQRAAGRVRAEQVHAAWRLHARLVRRALERGFYQGWDLHPAPAGHPVRRHLRLLPRAACRRPRPAGRLPGPGRRRGPRRAGHRTALAVVAAARAGLRGARRDGGRVLDGARPHGPRGARAAPGGAVTYVDLVVRAPRAVTATGDAVSVGVTDGRIVAVEPYASPPRGRRTVELDDDEVLLPGLVDTHVHVNEPGRTEWEGFATATRGRRRRRRHDDRRHAAQQRPADGRRRRRSRPSGRRREAQCHVDVGFWGGAIPGNAGDLRPLHDAGVFGFKCFLLHSGVDEFPPLDPAELARRCASCRASAACCSCTPRTPQSSTRAPAHGAIADFLASRPRGGREPRDRRGDRGGPRGPAAAPTSCTCPRADALPADRRGARPRACRHRGDLPALPDASPPRRSPTAPTAVQVLPADPRARPTASALARPRTA